MKSNSIDSKMVSVMDIKPTPVVLGGTGKVSDVKAEVIQIIQKHRKLESYALTQPELQSLIAMIRNEISIQEHEIDVIKADIKLYSNKNFTSKDLTEEVAQYRQSIKNKYLSMYYPAVESLNKLRKIQTKLKRQKAHSV